MDYPAFWHEYLRAHRRQATRLTHYGGSLAALACLAVAAVTLDWRWLVAAPLVGYACAWASHVGLEGNTPKTFGHPLWSLFSDYRMLALWVSGGLQPHLDAANTEGPGVAAGALALSGGTRRET
ncbi:MAG: DUF962 domain-containing protein [Acidisphaera sp.]|nr:DUF962 domain-containing protein [Acidisphaera sp.]MBV9813566.1 DUF962 domain-containing protein [Acetobacteraceae bacterium]